ncbi:MAG: hypothetical protein KDC24_01030 [Saprospiraceae bacterium]|nr:hypothetical protein [Saprospiraceae bacterium]
MTPEAKFEAIVAAFQKKEQVAPGKMMSSPALQYKGKVFAFFYQDKMCFKLGKSFQPEDSGINEWQHLSPFKNKPPMTAWFVIDPVHSDQWENLSQMALEAMQ